MKKTLLIMLSVCSLFLTGCSKSAVVLNTTPQQAVGLLDTFVTINNLVYLKKDTDNNAYLLGQKGLISGILDNGSYTPCISCYFRALTPNDTLIRCSDVDSSTKDAANLIGNYTGVYGLYTPIGYRKFFKELKVNCYNYVSVKEFRKMQKNRF